MAIDDKLTTKLLYLRGVPVVQVHGEIDLYTVEAFDAAVRSGVEQAENALVVDLRDITYIDSAGLSTLIAAYKALAARRAVLYIAADKGRPGVRRVLEITRLDTLIPIRDSVDIAVDELSARKAG